MADVNGAIRLSCSGGVLHLQRPDGTTVPVTPVLLLPVQDPQGPVSLVDEDKKECALVTDRTALDAASRRALEDVLARRHLWSVIEAVVAADIDHGLRRLTVRTDRGLRSILIGDPDKHLRECDRGARLIIDDLAGNRFIVPRLGDLDPRSRALLKDVL